MYTLINLCINVLIIYKVLNIKTFLFLSYNI